MPSGERGVYDPPGATLAHSRSWTMSPLGREAGPATVIANFTRMEPLTMLSNRGLVAIVSTMFFSWSMSAFSINCNDWDVDDRRSNFFRDATEKEIEACIDSGRDPNAQDEFGQTPMHMLSWTDTFRLISILKTNGSKLNAQDFEGWTPLHVAARYGYKPEMLQALIDAGADPSIRNKRGETACDLVSFNEFAAEEIRKNSVWNKLCE